MADKRKLVNNLRDRIRNGPDVDDDDRDVLLAFSDEMFLLKTEYGDHRHEKLLRHAVRMSEHVGGLVDALDDRDAAEEVVRWINRTYDNEETNRDYRIALRMFGRRTNDADEVPESMEWIPTGTSRNYKPKPRPGDMLKWREDVLPLIEATHNTRDPALIAVAWDSGAWSGELQDLTVDDVSDHNHGMQITVDGKTGQRSVTLIPSVPYLQRWLSDHPARHTPDTPLWSKLSKPEGISYNALRKTLNRAAEAANVSKPVNLTNFRKSSASYLASQNVNQAHLEDHHGWVRGSDVAARYISTFGGETDREIARAHGLEVEVDEPDPIAPTTCPRCSKETPRDEEFCVWCGQAVERGAVDTVRQQQKDARDAVLRLAQEDDSLLSTVDQLQDVLSIAQENPGFLDDAEEFVEALQTD